MVDKNIDIRDDEFRVIGHAPKQDASSQEKGRRNLVVGIISGIIVIAIGILAIVKWPKEKPQTDVGGVFEGPETIDPVEPAAATLGHETSLSYTEKKDTVINDVQLSLYIPHNAIPELTIGVPSQDNADIILIAQAADIRADNLEILGSFVLKGDVIAHGSSKKGFCAIIDNQITIGVNQNSPLFEEAAEKDGYFFRQYPLVDNGTLVDNTPKGKAMRKALCSRAGEIFIVVSETDESFHDFSQALVDLGVENAIYLVGGRGAFGWYLDADGEQTLFGQEGHKYKNENYIVWILDNFHDSLPTMTISHQRRLHYYD